LELDQIGCAISVLGGEMLEESLGQHGVGRLLPKFIEFPKLEGIHKLNSWLCKGPPEIQTRYL